jgi:hypothetical protein
MTPDPGPEPALFLFSIWFQFQPLSEHPYPTFYGVSQAGPSFNDPEE